MTMAMFETSDKEMLEAGMQKRKGRRCRHGAIRPGMVLTIREMPRCYARFIWRWVTAALKNACKRVSPFHQ
jgi:hypothetical protein